MEKITDHQRNVQPCRCDTGFASTNLETGSSLAGISVALNNYYAGNAQPEKKLASSYNQLEATETKKAVKQRLQQRQRPQQLQRQKQKPRPHPEQKQRQKQRLLQK